MTRMPNLELTSMQFFYPTHVETLRLPVTGFAIKLALRTVRAQQELEMQRAG